MARKPRRTSKAGKQRKAKLRAPIRARAKARRAARQAAPKKITELTNERQVHDFEDLLIKSLAVDNSGSARDISMQDLLLDLTKSGRKLAYNYGFTVGTGIYSENGKLESLFSVLEKFGLGRVLYQPAQDSLIITAREGRLSPPPVGGVVHVYEAGIMAGYLTASVGRRVMVKETHCKYNGSTFCQFVAEPNDGEIDYGKPLAANIVIDAIARTIRDLPENRQGKADHNYYLLPTLPLMKSPLVDEASKLLYVIGIRIAELGGRETPARTIEKIASYFDIGNAQLLRSGSNRRIIRLKYKHYNSIDQLVKLSTSMVIGYANAAFDSEAELEMSTSKDNSYVVRIRLEKESRHG